jgi:ATP-dependent exoDNAse (exonuclease V) beta subunit
VIAAGAEIERIAAVTFTVAAAGQMKLRIGQKLEQAGHAGVVRRLERAFVGTIHAFCANMLRQRPVEAGVDPAFEELAEPERVFSRVFESWLRERLSAGSPVLRRSFARLAWRDERRGKSPVQSLQDCAWELTQWRDHPAPWTRREFNRDAEIDSLVKAADAVIALRDRSDRKNLDLLYRGLQPLADFLDRVRCARALGQVDYDTWEAELLALPGAHRFLKSGSGKFSQSVTREQVKEAWDQLCERIDLFGRQADALLAVELRDEFGSLIDRYEAANRRAGQLDFLDLLVRTNALLDQPEVCEYFQNRYEYLFVDEFQDTDPLQTDILTKLAGDRCGRLFVVGDPKQSIYRFRRADVASFTGTCDRFVAAGAVRDQLRISHRSTRPIQEFVNTAFSSQIEGYLSLEGGREPVAKQPSVLALPIPEPYGKVNIAKAAINKCTPVTVAAFVQWLIGQSNWTVLDPKMNEQRPVEARDVCILFRRFSNDGKDLTQDYVRCLEAQGLPHVLVGSKSFHHREEIAAIRTALRAIEWSDDELSVYATIRNFYGVLDGTLFRYKHKYGQIGPFKHLPADTDPEFTPILDALRDLEKLHKERNDKPIADSIHLLLENVRALTAFSLRKGGRRVVANVQRLLDMARSFEVREATSFRSFVLYLEEQKERGEASDAPVLELESDGVKIMTVHKAKGLEFPVVILADLTAHLTGRGDRYVNPDRKLCAQRMLGCAPWDLLDNLNTETELDRQEGVRVAYAAATRARDLLVVCAVGDSTFVNQHPLYREGWLAPLYPALYPNEDRWRSPSRRVNGQTAVLQAPAECGDDRFLTPGLHTGRLGACPVWWFDPARLNKKDSVESGLDDKALLQGDGTPGFEDYDTWRSSTSALIAAGSEPSFRVTLASESEARDNSVEVISVARTSTAKASRRFGKMVHGILQHAHMSDIETVSKSQMREHGCTEEERESALIRVRAALNHELLAAARRAERVCSELPVMVRVDETVVEGRADLAYFDGLRWTVIDFKTGRADARDRAQIHLYATALHEATGQAAKAVILEI